jgi:MYXO-CTERM domain-containing protein
MKSLSKRLESHLAACAVAVAAGAASTADAAVVSFTYGANGIQVPADGDGLYFNLLTGVTGTSAGSVGTGPWMNPYGSSTTNMAWFASTAGGSWRGVNIGQYSNEVSNLGVGFTISSAIPNTGAPLTPRFNTSGGTSWADGLTGDFVLNSLNYFGFRFQVGTATHYGYGVMRMGASITERWMMGFAYESTAGAAITTGVIPAPGAVALLGLAGVAGRRRRG